MHVSRDDFVVHDNMSLREAFLSNSPDTFAYLLDSFDTLNQKTFDEAFGNDVEGEKKRAIEDMKAIGRTRARLGRWRLLMIEWASELLK